MTTETLPQLPPVAPVADPNDVGAVARSRGVLVSLEVTVWSGRKLDKSVTADTNDRAGADKDAGRYNKNLLGGKVDSYSACVAAAGAARVAHYEQSLPWSDEGSRLLPITNYFEYAKMVREHSERFKLAVAAFVAEYPTLREEARARLGSMYNASDYPDVSEIAKRFRFRVLWGAVPSASDIRVDLTPEVLSHMERSITARVERATNAAMREGWNRMAESVAKIRDRLREIAARGADEPSGRLHAALFENAIETAETLKRLNILDDPHLAETADTIIRELAALDPKALRKDATAMEATAARADEILSSMAAFYGGAA